MDLDSRQVRYVMQVAHDLNFTRAARQLHVAQQTLSESVNQLERQLGVQLFERSTQRVELTAAGQAFVEQAGALLRQVEQTIAVTLAAARSAENTVTTGSPDWPTGIELFRRGIDAYRASRADASVVLDPTPWIRHIDAVQQRRIDLGVTFLAEGDALPDGIECVELLRDSASWVYAAVDHPLAALDRVTIDDLLPYPVLFVARRDHPRLHDALAAHLRAHGVPATAEGNPVPSFASAAAHSMVADTVVWVSASMARSAPSGLRAVRVEGLDVPLRLVAFHRRGDDRAAGLAHHIAAAADASGAG